MSVISYPYSSRIFRRNLSRTTNEKFGEEFKRCVSRIVDIIDQISTKSDDTIISEPILYPGDCSMTFRGGHNYLILEDDTIVYEYKTGPYLGQEFDKEFINTIK